MTNIDVKEYLDVTTLSSVNKKPRLKQNASRAQSSFDEYEMKNIFSSNLLSRDTSSDQRKKLLSRDDSVE